MGRDHAAQQVLIDPEPPPLTMQIFSSRRYPSSARKAWARLVRVSAREERLAVVRAAAAHPSPAVTAALLEVLAGGDVDAAAAAAVSLGTPGNDAAVTPLRGALAHDEGRLRMAAIRALGRIGTARAREALALAAAFHPDPPTRRRANAEVIVVQRGISPSPQTLLRGRAGKARPVRAFDQTSR